jgi:hypothetical protein
MSGGKFAKVKGAPPVLQFVAIGALRLDPAYQRSTDNGPSRSLILRLANEWDWRLCQPLAVARRVDLIERLFVIDGQHRLEAARLRGDIAELPCTVADYSSVAEEADGFVRMNRNRKALSRLDLYKASLQSGDPHAAAINEALAEAGLTMAPHSNNLSWKPGMVGNIGGIEASWREYGPEATRLALRMLGEAFAGQVLSYAGTIFPGIAAIVADELDLFDSLTPEKFEAMQTMLVKPGQKHWRDGVMQQRADLPKLRFARASAMVMRRAWRGHQPLPLPVQFDGPGPGKAAVEQPELRGAAAPAPGKGQGGWCEQCDQRRGAAAVAACQSRFCPLKGLA